MIFDRKCPIKYLRTPRSILLDYYSVLIDYLDYILVLVFSVLILGPFRDFINNRRLAILVFLNKDIILKESFFLSPIRKDNSALAILNICLPFAKVPSAVIPGHLSEPIPEIFDIVAGV